MLLRPDANHGDEIYEFLRIRINVTRAKHHIDAGKIPYDVMEYNITPYATKMLALNPNNRDEEPVAIMHRINYDFVREMPEERLIDPIFIVLVGYGDQQYSIVFDGNHRIVKAFKKGMLTLTAYVFHERDIPKMNAPTKQVRKISKAR